MEAPSLSSMSALEHFGSVFLVLPYRPAAISAPEIQVFAQPQGFGKGRSLKHRAFTEQNGCMRLVLNKGQRVKTSTLTVESKL